ncbi:MAG: cytochrome P450 [Akkermansiaceae bacterium]
MPTDPFRKAREEGPVLKCPFQGEEIPMLLKHADVRAAAKDWKTYSSDAPFRVPIPSEEEMRTMRQLPIETNPPEHGEWRKLVEPFFLRAKKPEVIVKVDDLISEMLASVSGREFDAVREFAIPIQCRALTYLLDVPESEGEIFMSWGMHVFSDEGGSLEEYLQQAFDRAEANPSDDFFSALTKATFRERPLTRDEMMGFANLTFAGGRDTIIHSITNILAYFAKHPIDLQKLRENPKGIVLAGEEFFRAFMPLTHIGRVCPVTTDVQGHEVPPNGRVSLGWAAANFDSAVFSNPEFVQLDRKPNPHVSFGFGTHLCLGAPHARLIVRTLLTQLVEKVDALELISANVHVEKNPSYERVNGFDELRLKIEMR